MLLTAGLSLAVPSSWTAAASPLAMERAGPAVEFRRTGDSASIENRRLRVVVDLEKGVFSVVDRASNRAVLENAAFGADTFSSRTGGVVLTCRPEPLADALGMGRSLLVMAALPGGGPRLLLRLSLYESEGFIALAGGVDNTTANPLQIKEIRVVDAGSAFKGLAVQADYKTLDGHGGGAKTAVQSDTRRPRTCRNNMLATFGKGAGRRSVVAGGLTYAEFEKYAVMLPQSDAIELSLCARDPVGRRIDPGSSYLPPDRFYLDLLTANPFDALEAYGQRLRLAQGVVLPVWSFPILDLWEAQVDRLGGGMDPKGYRAHNDSPGAVEEMECIARSGFLRYTPVAVMLEPDLYDPDNQQGWWDDEHWRRGPDARKKGLDKNNWNGQFVPPYETVRKWAGAVRALGGIPMTYLQTGFRSKDYAEKFPGHMRFNQPFAPHLNEKGEPQYRDKDRKEPRHLGYDYTDPGFVAHVRDVWENLRLAGVAGIKFDYPDLPFTGWPEAGGLEDPFATAAMHYRAIFRLARDGLGPQAYLYERALDRGSDVTLGLVATQRTEGDTDRIDRQMVTRNGLRWYKNRVVMNYDMDAKNPLHAEPANRDGERAMLTMTYTVAGTLMCGPSFGRLSPAQVHDLSRIYPFHPDRQSARPADAFVSEFPRVYDFKVSPQWHQVAFFNFDTTNRATVGADLSGDTAAGALGLDAAKSYYVYDFWNDRLVGKLAGSGRLEQELRPGEARMMSVREVAEAPQYLSTGRHVMQGCVDMLGCDWDAERRELRGVSAVVGGDPYRIVIACNGRTPVAAKIDDAIRESLKASNHPSGPGPATAALRRLPGADGLAELVLERPDNGPVAWSVAFE